MEGLRHLKQNISAYNRRAYLERTIIGSFITLGVALSLWLLFALAEYALNLGTFTRSILFFGFLFVILGLIVIQVVRPLLRMLGILKQAPYHVAAIDISGRLPQVEDRLINVLNLERKLNESQTTLLRASLEQETGRLNAYQFSQSIDLRSTLRWLKYTLTPLGAFLVIALWNPDIISQGSSRLIQYNQDFKPVAPFSISLMNDDLGVPEGDDLLLSIEASGSSLPSNMFIEIAGTEFRMKPGGGGRFSYELKNIRRDMEVRFRATSVTSERFRINVLSRPKLVEQVAYLDYPPHTGMPNERTRNRSQLQVPQGTRITWGLKTKDAGIPEVKAKGIGWQVDETEEGYVFENRMMSPAQLTILLNNEDGLMDSSLIVVNVIQDAFPQIVAERSLDSVSGQVFFQGEIGDDYGLTRMQFVVESADGRMEEVPIDVLSGRQEQAFVFSWSPDSLLLQPGDEVDYYFEVWDNDGINGAKKSTSQSWQFKKQTFEEVQKEQEKLNEKTKNALSSQSHELEKMDEMLDEIRKDLLEKKRPDWEEKEALKEVLEKQKEMVEKLEKKADQQRMQQNKSFEYNQYSEELMQKQQRIQELFEQLFDEEFKEMYEEYNQMLEEFNKDQMLNKIEEMKLDNEQLEKELDRTLELFKQLEFEQKLEENLNRIDELVQEQEELNNATENEERPEDELSAEQEELSDKLDALSEEMDKLEELNDELEKPEALPNTEESEESAKENMQKAKEELDKGKSKKANEPQKKAKESLEEMQKKLSGFQQEMNADKQSEDLDDMRQLLENIVELSKNQERVMEDIKPVQQNDPQYVLLTQKQKGLIDDSKIIEDSLLALSKRVPTIDKMVNDEISAVKFNMSKSLDYLSNQPPRQEDKYKAMAVERQQYAMTSLNNLALLFDEIIQQMQQQMQSSMKGTGQCNKPGSTGQGEPSAADMRKMQQSLNKKLEQMKKAMEEGKNPNGKKPGQTKGMGMGGMSKEMAQMAAEQAALRRQLREMSESLEKDENGGGAGGTGEIEKMMEQTEEDILFGKISAETIRRQQDIITRLLESEKAEREREKDNKRESVTNQTKYDTPPELWEEYLKKRDAELELYKTVPPNLKPFYRKEVNRYFSNLR